MLDYGFYNMDCMDGMKQFPDKYFDLAIVDPPYGDARGGLLIDSESVSTATRKMGGGDETRTGQERTKTRRNMGLCELEERGRRNTQKNHNVGRCPR